MRVKTSAIAGGGVCDVATALSSALTVCEIFLESSLALGVMLYARPILHPGGSAPESLLDSTAVICKAIVACPSRETRSPFPVRVTSESSQIETPSEGRRAQSATQSGEQPGACR
jgi:hypothetical protein